MRGIHRNHQHKRFAFLAFSLLILQIADSPVGFVLRPPLIHIIKTIPDGMRIPIHRAQMIIVSAISNPIFETMPPANRTPFIPCHFSPVVIGIHKRTPRRIQMPLSHISGGIAFIFQHIRPATGTLLQFHPIRSRRRIAISGHPVRQGILSGHQHGAGGRRHRITAYSIVECHPFPGKPVEVRSYHRLDPFVSQCLTPPLVGHDKH